jgi:site-specific DNA-cytosine methylase
MTMKVLVACEYSGVVRDAFSKKGHDAWSCDLLPSEVPGNHIQCSALDIFNDGWDLMIAHPPCTHLACSGAAHFEKKRKDGRQKQGIELFMAFANAQIDKICIENPVGIMSTEYRKPDQTIQPYYWGDPVKKTTHLWLKNLPLLTYGTEDSLFWEKTSVDPELVTLQNGKVFSKWDYEISCMKHELRGKLRSKTFQGIADAMANQWG